MKGKTVKSSIHIAFLRDPSLPSPNPPAPVIPVQPVTPRLPPSFPPHIETVRDGYSVV